MATLPLAVAEAHLAKTDAMLLALSTGAMAMLGHMYLTLRRPPHATPPAGDAAVFWLAVGGALLIKGPVILLLIGATIATLCLSDRSAALVKSLRLWWGLPLAAAVVAPWLITLAGSGDAGFVGAAVREDLLPKLIGGQEGHGAPPGSYLLALTLTAWPWSLLLPLALFAAWPDRHVPAVRFCLAWLVPTWLAFEAVPTKLPHYVLPLLPAAALLIGAMARDGETWGAVLDRMGSRAWRFAWATLCIALAATLVLAAPEYGTGTAPGTALTTAGCLAAAVTAAFLHRLRARAGMIALALAGVLLCTGLLTAAPRLQTLWISPRLAAAIGEIAPTGPVALVGFREPSAVFLLGTKTRFADGAGAAALLATEPGALVAVDQTLVPSILAALSEKGMRGIPHATIAGHNYARGQPITLTLLTAGPAS
jgi:4-amino-4-deoxy-L-arabinose transferase-like glycosyltransferase